MPSMRRSAALVTATLVAATIPALGGLAGASAEHTARTMHLDGPVASPPSSRRRTASERALARYGYLVPHRAAYARAKIRASERPLVGTGASASGGAAPSPLANFAGVNDANATPSDSTGAIGIARYIELVNVKFGIYDRSQSLVAQGDLHTLVGASRFDNVFDPQIIWDPGTNRFYYAADQITSAGDNLLAVGFSKTATPNGAAGFCKYSINYGPVDFPDYPKLGDTKNFWVLGVNVFSPTVYSGSDLLAINKPSPGSRCPKPSTLGVKQKTDIKNADGTRAFTPVPANQTDPNSTGWVVARPLKLPASFLTVYRITRSRTTGNALISAGRSVKVPFYTIPADAPQDRSVRLLDTSDTRNTQAVSAKDPSRAGRVGLWTQHTTGGGAGAEVRWYEINPALATVMQRGKATDQALYAFNGAVSPDRKVSTKATAFGANMVLNYNTSSALTFPAIKVVSKVGSAAQSAPVTVITSRGPHLDFACDESSEPDTCRWGDYAAATPDPGAPTVARTGVVYGTSQYTKGSLPNTNAGKWLTRNFAFRPQR